jgi:rod shape-determining protein MreC
MYRRTGRGRLLLVVFVGLCIVLITLDFRQGEGGPLERAKDISAAIVDPIQRGFSTVFEPVGDFFSSLADLGDLRSDNARLEAANAEMSERINDAEAVEDENAQLRAQLELDESYVSMQGVNAEVIARPSSNFRWFVTIDKGSDDGIREDMAVITPDGLAGKIIKTQADTATVLLLIDPEGAAAATVRKSRDVIGTVQGHGAGQPLSFDFVDPDVVVEEGDEVVTSYYNEGIFPPNIRIGTVSDVGTDSAAAEQDIEVEPGVDFTSLDFVLVLLESGPKLQAEDRR